MSAPPQHATPGAENAPVLVAFHGVPTDRIVTEELSAEFARRGYVVFNAWWQLDEAFNAGSMWHGACAVRFARENAERYGGDPGNVTTVGYSAGGSIGATLGLNGDDFTGQCASDASISGVPDRVVGLAGVWEAFNVDIPQFLGAALFEQDPERWELVNAYEHLDQAAGTSWLLIHGEDDDTIPTVWTPEFGDALTSKGADVTTHLLPGVGHWLGGGEALQTVADYIDAWMSTR